MFEGETLSVFLLVKTNRGNHLWAGVQTCVGEGVGVWEEGNGIGMVKTLFPVRKLVPVVHYFRPDKVGYGSNETVGGKSTEVIKDPIFVSDWGLPDTPTTTPPPQNNVYH